MIELGNEVFLASCFVAMKYPKEFQDPKQAHIVFDVIVIIANELIEKHKDMINQPYCYVFNKGIIKHVFY